MSPGFAAASIACNAASRLSAHSGGSAQPIHAPHLQRRQLFVLGDSHTAAYRTLLKQVSVQLGVTVIEHERGGCGVVRLIDADPPECADSR
ncbi:MAG: hypothetical protein ABS955_12375, partial [Stenotrophomonas maltophilia]